MSQIAAEYEAGKSNLEVSKLHGISNQRCPVMVVQHIPAGHWLPLERKAQHIQAIRPWLQSKNL